MKISISMTTFNGGKYLPEQLQSILAQTRLPEEVVICDDCSTDDTVAILNDFRKLAPFEVKIVKNEKNIGPINNFSKSMELTSGDIIFLCDQDDFWFKNKIEVVEGFFNRNRESLCVINNQEITDANLRPSGVTKLGQISSLGGERDWFYTGCCVAIRSNIKRILLPIPEEFGSHDSWIFHVIRTIGGKRIVLEDVLQYSRRHEGNTSDWIISRTRMVGRLDTFRTLRTRMDPRPSYENRKTALRVLMERVELLGDQFFNELMLGNGLRYSRDRISREINALTIRGKLFDGSWSKRFLLASKMLISGEYGNFQGFKSFLKDILYF
jgi:glycosyltransferase involved in cell wall biosynthesis